MNSKHAILDRLRKHRPLSRAITAPATDSYVTKTRHRTQAERIAQFRQMIEANYAEVYDVTKANWRSTLLQIADDKNLTQWLYAPTTDTGKALQALVNQSDGCSILLTPYSESLEAIKDRVFNDIEASLTTARGAIADTGTLVLWPTPEEPRTMSLVPPVHVALLRASTIRSSFAETIADERWAESGMTTNILLVSGPSKTADIQRTLAYGAHGPRELIVPLICDE